MVDLSINGEMNALSLDFGQHELNQILSKAPDPISTFIKTKLLIGPNTPRTIAFEGEIVFGIRARPGELPQTQKESFVPLVAQEII